MKKNIMLLFIIFLAVMFLSTPVMAKSKKSDKKPWYSYFAMKAKIISLERKLRSKIKEIRKLKNKNRKLASQKRGPRGPKGEPGLMGPMGPVGPMGPEGPAGATSSNTSTGIDFGASPLVCPGCRFTAGKLPIEVEDRLQGAYLPYAYFAGTVLSGVDLSGTDLRGASLIYGDLSKADLTGANLSVMPWVSYNGTPMITKTNLVGTDMTDAILDGVIWGDTICPDGTNSDDDDGDGNTCLDNLVP